MRRTFALIILAALLFAQGTTTSGTGKANSEAEDYTIDREDVFEFAQKPTLAKDGDRVTVSFETEGRCDVAVVIERQDGSIIRHVGYGVLGPNAPEPFQKDSLAQSIVWDGKDELGHYVDDLKGVQVRVSLGLKPQLERTLFWHPKKRMRVIKGTVPRFVAQPEGVYVYDAGGPEQVKLFDHDGKYIRTICPFPAKDVEKVKGLEWYTFADGYKAPKRRGEFFSTFMAGDTQGKYEYGHAFPARGFTVRNGSIASVRESLCRLGVGESLNKHELYGPKIPNWPAQSIALSPDKKWLYLTAFWRNGNWIPGERGLMRCLHHVARMEFDSNKSPEVWLGEPNKMGKDDKHFAIPSDVCVDAEGRVYIADNYNDRVQIFSPDGKLLKSLAMKAPAKLDIHHKTQELYAFCFPTGTPHPMTKSDPKRAMDPVLRILSPFKSDKSKAEIPIPFEHPWARAGVVISDQIDECPIRVALDSYTDPPTVWLNAGVPDFYHRKSVGEKAQISIFRIKDNKQMVLMERWNEIVKKALNHWRPRRYKRGRMYVDPRNGMLYIAGEWASDKTSKNLYRIDPSDGRITVVDLPYNVEDAAIDGSGHIYLRCAKLIGRFNLDTMREVPFDYGEERVIKWYGSGGPKPRRWMSVLVEPGTAPGFWHEAGMGVSPKGELVIATYNSRRPVGASSLFPKGRRPDRQAYTPQIYRGRACVLEIHIWDKHGKPIVKDAVKGLPNGHGTMIDPRGDVYYLASGTKVYDGKPFYRYNGTLMKFKRGKGKLYTGKSAELPLSKEDATHLADLPRIDSGPMGHMIVQDAEWLYPGVGYCNPPGGNDCECFSARFAVDYFGRVFAPEFARQQVAVLDTNGNLVMHIGRYGNIDDGVPLFPNPIRDARYPPRSIGGDEVALAYANFTATHTDHRLFIYDGANDCIRSVKLGYHAEERMALNP